MLITNCFFRLINCICRHLPSLTHHLKLQNLEIASGSSVVGVRIAKLYQMSEKVINV